jgi:carbon monoxide dehydrogenase subunit G
VSRNEIRIDAPVDTVFAVLQDPRRYADWVLGAVRIRTADDDFPAPGTSFGHQVGIWPVLVKDETKVLTVDGDRHLTLRAEIGPFGAATVDLQLESVDGDVCTRVVMTERPVTGPIRWLHNPLQDRVFWLRNCLSLLLLKRVAEGRGSEPHEPSGEPT